MPLLTEKELNNRKQIIFYSRDGYKANLLNWHDVNNIDIIFENNVIKTGLKWNDVKNGKFSLKEEKQIDYRSIREGMVITNKQGRQVKIVEYINAFNMTVIFLDDWLIKRNVQFNNFKNGSVIHPDDLISNKYKKNKSALGQKRKSLDGYMAEVISYNKATDFEIMFNDKTKKHLSCWKKFDKGEFTYSRKNNFKLTEGEIENRKKIVFENKEGYKMWLHEWRNFNDIDIEFEDGTIVYNKDYPTLTQLSIRHPKYGCLPKEKLLKLESLDAIKKVLYYRNKQDMDVEMYDGTICKHTTLALCFGKLSKKYSATTLSEKEIEYRMSLIVEINGRRVHIKEFRSSVDIDLEFDDGVIIKNKTYHQFINKKFKHPKDKTEDAMLSKIIANYKRGAKDRGLEFKLSREEVADILHKPCYLCGRKDVNQWNINGSGIFYKYNGIDRVDNSKGYLINNVKPCCFDCNHAKSKYDLNGFLEWVSLIAKNLESGKIAV